jgi:hypothetical protein
MEPDAPTLPSTASNVLSFAEHVKRRARPASAASGVIERRPKAALRRLSPHEVTHRARMLAYQAHCQKQLTGPLP